MVCVQYRESNESAADGHALNVAGKAVISARQHVEENHSRSRPCVKNSRSVLRGRVGPQELNEHCWPVCCSNCWVSDPPTKKSGAARVGQVGGDPGLRGLISLNRVSYGSTGWRAVNTAG